jgi:hypothetical protein
LLDELRHGHDFRGPGDASEILLQDLLANRRVSDRDGEVQ